MRHAFLIAIQIITSIIGLFFIIRSIALLISADIKRKKATIKKIYYMLSLMTGLFLFVVSLLIAIIRRIDYIYIY